MGRKCIMINKSIIEDLIYGRVGIVKSDAPKGMEVVGVYSETQKHSLAHTDSIIIYVEHPDFEENETGKETPVLFVTFTNDMDLDTQELVKRLRDLNFADDADLIWINIICEKLTIWDTKYHQLFTERNELRRENTQLQSKIDTILNIVRAHG